MHIYSHIGAKDTTVFDKSYALLNEQQKRAVDAIEGPVMIIAGPGTGKTTILTLRIANILKKTDTAPENILALTFTESASHAMRRKLADIIGTAAFKVHIHTFHGFAEKLIGEYPDFFARIIGSSVIHDIDQYHIIETILRSDKIELLRPYGDPLYYVKPILREIHILKRENISPNEFYDRLEREENEEDISEAERAKRDIQKKKNKELAYVYEAYEAMLARKKLYDFDDMLLELIRAMEQHEELKLMLQESFQYVLADEHQDANASQNRILELLVDFHESPNIFIVGDEKQAIYRFQGASLENFLYFTHKYPDATVIDLVHNYRSHQVILDAAHSLIEKNPAIPGRTRTRLTSLQVGGRPLRIIELPSPTAEYAYIVGAIKDMVGHKTDGLSEIAILYRDNKYAQGISKALKEAGIPYRIESDIDVLSHDLILKVDMLLRVIHDPSNNEYMSRVLLFQEFDCDPGDVRGAYREATSRKELLYTILKQRDDSTGIAYTKIARWSHLSEEMQCTDLIDLVIRESGIYTSLLSSPDAVDRLAALETFYAAVRDMAGSKKTFYLSDYVAYMDIIREHGILAKKKYTQHAPGVRLMTAHRSKGLEFNVVFIIHAHDGIWGNRSSRQLFHIPATDHARDMGRIDDERRLFYVALTRAREYIYITHSAQDEGKDLVPSQFLFEIDDAYINRESLVSDLKSSHIVERNMVTAHAHGPALFDPAFVGSIFDDQALSVTHLNNFLTCPWKYFFMNLIRIPRMEEKHQMYGTAIHATLKAYFDQYAKEHDFDSKKIIALFTHELDALPFHADDREDSLKKGKKALTSYIKAYYPTWPRHLYTEHSVTAYMDLPLHNTTASSPKRIKITGTIDKIEIIDGQLVNVVDYKTGKPKSRNDIEGKTKHSDGAYMRQLVFYKLLLDADGKYEMRSGELDFIEPNERGKHRKESFEITKEHTEKLVEDIVRMYQSVHSMSFIGQTCGDEACEYCRLARIVSTS